MVYIYKTNPDEKKFVNELESVSPILQVLENDKY